MSEINILTKQLDEANARIFELKKRIAKHPAARANRIVKLFLFAAGGLVLLVAALGVSFGETSVAVQLFVGILLVMPEALGKAAATDAAKTFASSMGSALGRTIGKRGKE